MLTAVIFVIFSILATSSPTEIDYCNKKLCPSQGKHIRCNNDGEFSKNCTGFFELVNLDHYKSLILHEHHIYRNYIAGGNLPCFHQACRMPMLTWDTSLAKNAEYNVKTCVFAHDPCRSTPKYPYVGQNIYWAYTSKMNITWVDFIVEAIYLWFEEWKAANHSIINDYRKTDPQSGHFTLLVNDRNTKVGCACLNNELHTEPPRRQVIFTCDYTSANLRGFFCYKPGATASCCKQRNWQYSNLCNDRIDPNDIYWY